MKDTVGPEPAAPGGGCGGPTGSFGDSRRHRFLGAEDLPVQSAAHDTPASEIAGEAAKEWGRATQIEVGLGWHSQPLKHFEAQASGRIVVITEPISRSRFAVSDKASHVRERCGEVARFAGKGMLGGVSCAVEPPDFARRPARRQGVEHRQHGGRADPGTEQHHRSLAGLQGEASSRRADFEQISTLDPRVEKRAALAVRFLLDADPVGASVRVAPDIE